MNHDVHRALVDDLDDADVLLAHRMARHTASIHHPPFPPSRIIRSSDFPASQPSPSQLIFSTQAQTPNYLIPHLAYLTNPDFLLSPPCSLFRNYQDRKPTQAVDP